jgi:hypothetical protein
MQRASPGASEVEDALARVLARPEFAPTEPSRLAAWMGRLLEELGRAYGSLLERLSLADPGGSLLAWGLRVLLVIAAGLLVLHLVNSLAGVQPRRHRVRPLASAVGAGGEQEGWRGAARRAAAEGRFREAVLALYQALLQRLQEQGLVRYHPAKTPGDYRREMRPHPARASTLEHFLRTFEPVAFGAQEPDREVFERLEVLARETAGE